MTDETAVQLVYAIKDLPKLKALYINNNLIKDSGFVCLSILIASG